MKLEIKQLSKTFPIDAGLFKGSKGVVRAVDDVTIDVEKGDSLGIVGESGSGKTTLSKILAGFFKPDSGQVKFGDVDLLALDRFERAKRVQMVFQDPFSSLNPKLLLSTQLEEALRVRNPSNLEARAEQCMIDVGLSADHLRRYPHQLSGGQRQRFAIARALAVEPEILLADEPVSSLDLSVQSQIINLLNSLRQSKKFTQIIISHDVAVIANTCEYVLVMKDGRAVESGSIDQVLNNPQHAYTQRLLSAVPTL